MATAEEINAMNAAFAKKNGKPAPPPVTAAAAPPTSGDSKPGLLSRVGNYISSTLEPLGMAGKGAIAPRGSMLDSAMQGAGQGWTWGTSDELAAKLVSLGNGTPYEQELSKTRGDLDTAKSSNPLTYKAGEVAGSILSGGPLAKLLGTSMNLAGTVGKQALVSALQSGGTAFGEGEGGASQRIKDAVPAALVGAVLSVPFSAGGHVLGKMSKHPNSPLPDTRKLRDATNAAYDNLEKSPYSVKGDFLDTEFNKLRTAVTSNRLYNEKSWADQPVTDVLNHLDDNIKMPPGSSAPYKNMTIGQLNTLQKDIESKIPITGDRRLTDLAQGIKKIIAMVPEGARLQQEARGANTVLQQTLTLNKLVTKADDQASTQGLGANYSMALKSRVAKLLQNEKEMKYFSPEQKEVFQAIVNGDNPTKVQEWLGKFAPAGSGMTQGILMLGMATQPGILGVAGVGAVARLAANRNARDAMVSGINEVAGAPQMPQYAHEVSPLISGAMSQVAPPVSKGLGLDPISLLTSNVQGGSISPSTTLLDEAFKRKNQGAPQQ